MTAFAMTTATRLATTDFRAINPDKNKTTGNKTEFLGDRLMPRKMNGRHPPVKTNGAAVPPTNTTVVLTGRPAQKTRTSVPVEKVDATIDYDAVVVEGKEIVAALATAQNRRMRLGELADGVVKVYGESRLTKYAKDIGAVYCTLKRSRTVYRAWAGNGAAPPQSFAVAQELAGHPDRFDIIKADPDITTRKARQKMREHDQAEVVADPAKSRRDEQRRWFNAVVKRAEEVIRDADLANSQVSPQLEQALREVVEPDLLLTLREAAEGLTKLADYLERLATAPERRPLKRVRFGGGAARPTQAAPAQAAGR
jgi:hypothetical protein